MNGGAGRTWVEDCGGKENVTALLERSLLCHRRKLPVMRLLLTLRRLDDSHCRGRSKLRQMNDTHPLEGLLLRAVLP